MRARVVAVILVVALVPTAVAGCGTGPEPIVELAVQMGYSTIGPGDPMSFGPRGGGFEIRAWMRAPCVPYTTTGAAWRQGREVTLKVTGSPGTVCTATTDGSAGYEAEITGLAAGTYRLRVVHRYADRAFPDTTIFDGQLTAL
jgi:hypothetical protein